MWPNIINVCFSHLPRLFHLLILYLTCNSCNCIGLIHLLGAKFVQLLSTLGLLLFFAVTCVDFWFSLLLNKGFHWWKSVKKRHIGQLEIINSWLTKLLKEGVVKLAKFSFNEFIYYFYIINEYSLQADSFVKICACLSISYSISVAVQLMTGCVKCQVNFFRKTAAWWYVCKNLSFLLHVFGKWRQITVSFLSCQHLFSFRQLWFLLQICLICVLIQLDLLLTSKWNVLC